MLQVLYYTLFTRNSKNVNKSGSYFSQLSFHQYQSKYDSTNVHHATWVQVSTSLHQDIDEFYDNIIDTLLDDDMIALYMKL